MSSHNTDHLELHSWEPFDPFTREEFNVNFEKIDAAVRSDRDGIAKAQLTAEKAQSAADSALSAAQKAQSTADANKTTTDSTIAANKSAADSAIAALKATDAAHDTAIAALKADVKPGAGGKMARVAWGTVSTGTTPFSLNFSFRPLLVILGGGAINGISVGEILVRGWSNATGTSTSCNDTVTWTDTGFTLKLGSGNLMNRTVYYVVFGEALN